MKTLLIIGMGLIVFLAAAQMAGSWQFGRVLAGRLSLLRQTTATGAVDLPPAVEALALRGMAGAAPASEIRLTQSAEMRLKRGGGWSALTAEQWIDTDAPGFVWWARQPLGVGLDMFRVIDAYADGRGSLLVRLFGSIPMVRAEGDDIDTGEAMRYLAELPWVPDAMLTNPALEWSEMEDRRLRVGLRDMAGAEVVFGLNASGDLTRVEAMRPVRGDDGTVILRPWIGSFDDYREIGGRRIPAKAEVGYVYDGVYEAYFRGEITGLQAMP